MKTRQEMPVCQTCQENLLKEDKNMMLFYLDLCATHYFYGKPAKVEYNEDDYLSDDYLNHLESMGLVRTLDDSSNPKHLKVLPCMRQQLDDICYCSEEKKHFG